MNNSEEFREVCSSNLELLTDSGIINTNASLEDKTKIIQSLALNYVLLRNKAEIDQFITGFECLGTRKMMMRYPDLMSSYFLVDIEKPTAGIDCIAACYIDSTGIVIFHEYIFCRYHQNFIWKN